MSANEELVALLTERERATLALSPLLTDKAIAKALGLTAQTVEAHIDRAVEKLGVQNRRAAALSLLMAEHAVDLTASEISDAWQLFREDGSAFSFSATVAHGLRGSLRVLAEIAEMRALLPASILGPDHRGKGTVAVAPALFAGIAGLGLIGAGAVAALLGLGTLGASGAAIGALLWLAASLGLRSQGARDG